MGKWQPLKSRRVRLVAGAYVVLWLLTVVFGTGRVDRRFDQEFHFGYPSFSDERVEIVRLEEFNVRNFEDPRNFVHVPDSGLFRYRSRGIAIAPFVIVDEIGTVFGGLAGLGAIRINFWFFGYTKWWPAKVYWVV